MTTGTIDGIEIIADDTDRITYMSNWKASKHLIRDGYLWAPQMDNFPTPRLLYLTGKGVKES